MFATTLYAQEQTAAATNDSVPALTKKELRKQKVARRNLHYNILGGPSYTPDFGAVLGGSALMTFRINPSDTTQLRSVVPMAIAFMFNGGINLFSKPQLLFKGDRFRALPIGRIPLTVRRRTRHWRKRLQRNARWSWKASWSRTSIPETIMPSWRTRKRKPHPPAKNGSSGKFVQRLCGGWRKQPGRNPIF